MSRAQAWVRRALGRNAEPLPDVEEFEHEVELAHERITEVEQRLISLEQRRRVIARQ